MAFLLGFPPYRRPPRCSMTSVIGSERWNKGGSAWFPAAAGAANGAGLQAQSGRLVVLDALGDRQHRLDTVEAPGVVPEELVLHGGRDLVLGHQLERFPRILRIVVG